MKEYLQETELLNFTNPSISELSEKMGWKDMSESEKIRSIYNYVRDDIKFGYNIDDKIPASQVLSDGYGQCNTKAILFMTLLRKEGIPCRFHGFTIDKALQKGAISGIWYQLSPRSIVHSWVEIYHDGVWYDIEGFIIDSEYLRTIQMLNPDSKNFCGYGIATKDLMNPEVSWDRNNTYIQKEGINNDLGIYNDPDSFFVGHSQKLGHLKRTVYKYITRHIMNRNVKRIRTFQFKE